MRYRVFALIAATKFLGTVEADSLEEAEDRAGDLDCSINLCHQCCTECDGADVTELVVKRE